MEAELEEVKRELKMLKMRLELVQSTLTITNQRRIWDKMAIYEHK